MKGWMGKLKALSISGLMALVLSGCGKENLSVLQPKGEGAREILNLNNIALAVMIFVFIVVMSVYTIVLVRYRRKKGQEEIVPKQTEGNHALEVIWTVIPIILLLIIAIPTVSLTFSLADDSGAEDGIRVNVTGSQFWWHYEYEGEEIQTSQDLYIPTGEKVYLTMQSNDVMHSFWAPALTGKMDVRPDNENTMSISADEEGVYDGKCAELCGLSHSLMDFRIVAVSPEEYDQWVEDMQNADGETQPESESAQAGQALFEESCIQCHAVSPTQGSVGPNLANFGDRTQTAGVFEHDKETITEWILNPGEMKPGNEMADAGYQVTPEEAGQIADYLMQLQPSEINPESVEATE